MEGRRFQDQEKVFKIVVVGDPMTGKSCICKSFANKAAYKKPYQPTISETHAVSVLVGWKHHPMILWDTAGIEEWEHLRSRDYTETDCFICCYAINSPTSFANVESKWIPELRKYSPGTPIIIAGTKKDLRTPTNSHIREEEGRSLQSTVKAAGFIECSSQSISSLEALFIFTVSTILDSNQNCSRQTGGLRRRKFLCDIL